MGLIDYLSGRDVRKEIERKALVATIVSGEEVKGKNLVVYGSLFSTAIDTACLVLAAATGNQAYLAVIGVSEATRLTLRRTERNSYRRLMSKIGVEKMRETALRAYEERSEIR